jgi:two-component system sensor histidine kinase/response regulator
LPDPDRKTAPFSRHLLVAADAKAKRAAVVETLEQAGHRVDVVSDGTKAVQAILRRDYDAVLIDVRLRNMDGVETTVAIRDLPGDKAEVPIVTLVTQVLPDSYERYLTGDADNDAARLTDHEELFATIDALIAEPGSDTAEPGGDGSILDAGVLSNIRQLGAEDASDVFADLIGLFLDTTPPEMACLLDAMDARDMTAVETFAHKLKASCANVGAVRLSNALHDILMLAQGGDDDAVIARRDALCAESDRVYRGSGRFFRLLKRLVLRDAPSALLRMRLRDGVLNQRSLPLEGEG